MTSVAFDIAALDPAFKAHAARGIGRYVRELHRVFSENPAEDIRILPFSSAELLRSSPVGKALEILPFGQTTIRQQCLGPFAFKKLQTEVVHFPAHIDAPAWCPCKYIVTVLDLIPLIFADLYKADRPSWKFKFARWLECQAIKNASLVLCISQNTAKDVEQILSVPSDRLVVTQLGVDERFFKVLKPKDGNIMRAKLGISFEAPVILYLGGIDQRKNIEALISVFKRVRSAFLRKERIAPVLVVAGDIQKDKRFPELEAYVAQERVKEGVFFTGFLQEDSLLQLFSIAAAFFFPSFYEGFGLPPLEAMAAGVPVVSSNRSAMPEVLGDGALLVNPNDFQDASEALLSVLEDKNTACALIERGKKRARLFTWERTAACTLEAYRRVLRE